MLSTNEEEVETLGDLKKNYTRFYQNQEFVKKVFGGVIRANFVLSIIALVMAIVGCVLAVRPSFFPPVPLSEEKVIAMIEAKMKTYVTEEKVKEIIEGAIAALKPAGPEGGDE